MASKFLFKFLIKRSLLSLLNQFQKEIIDNLKIESQAGLEKFCNDISLESNQTESWHKIKNFLKPKGQRDYPALRLDVKTVKTNADKAHLFAETVERHFGIQSNNFDSNHFDEVNQFIEDNYEYFNPPENPDDYRSDMDDDHDLVAGVDSDTLIRIVNAGNDLTGYHPPPPPQHPEGFAPKFVPSPRAFAQQKIPTGRPNK